MNPIMNSTLWPTFFGSLLAASGAMMMLPTMVSTLRSKARDYGRVWDFDGMSAEVCPINWKGPKP